MKFSEQVLSCVWCVALGVLLSCASSVKQPIMENEENTAPPNLEQITEEDSILAEAYNVRGKAKSAQGDNISGITDYDKAIQLEWPHPEFYYNRGVANTALGHNSKAKADFKTALKLLKQTINVSKSVDNKTDLADMRIELDVRPDLKTDIEKALRLLK